MNHKRFLSILIALCMILTMIPATVFAEETVPDTETDHTHAYTASETVEPTCTQGGYTVYTCTCGESYTADETEPLGHVWDEGVVTLEPTTEAEGEILYTCTVCSETYTETVEKLAADSEEEEQEEEPSADPGEKEPEEENPEEPARGLRSGTDYWVWLQEQINNAGTDPDNPTLIELPDNVINTENHSYLEVNGKSVKIDLKGKTIDRMRTSSDSDGHVIEVMNGGTLTICDSVGSGTITGGWATNGGGINIQKNSKVIFQGGTISGNHGSDGGGVYVRGTFEMTGGSITGNTASVDGGGIFVTDTGWIDLERITISGNTADDDGGGLYLHLTDDATISGCDINNNTAGDYGGGLYMDAADKTLTLDNDGGYLTKINNNHSSDDGAGIYLFRGTINMTGGGSISGNTTDNDGGGVKVTNNTTFTANGVTISGNKALSEEGGGVKTFGTTTLTNCIITGNSAKKQGGGIFNDDSDGSGGDLTIDGCTISGNSTDSNGGGIYSDKKLTIKGNTVIGSSTAGRGNYAAGKGCGVFIGADSDTTYIQDKLIVQDNISSAYGQEMYLNGNRKLTLSGALTEGAKIGVTMNNGTGTFITNFNQYNSGSVPSAFFFSPEGLGVSIDANGEVQLESSWPDLQAEIDAWATDEPIKLGHDYTAVSGNDRLKITKNITIDLNGYTLNRNLTSEKTDGHVIEVFDGAALTIKDSYTGEDRTGRIMGGYSAHGGGIFVNKGATLRIESGIITANKADEDGGGVYVKGTLIMTGGSIINNTADVDGGGIFVTADGSIDLRDAEIKGNTADDDGGGIYMHLKSDSTVSGCRIASNKSGDLGGGIYMDASGKTLTIKNSDNNNTQIEYNNSSDDGAGIYLYRGKISMSGGSISNNTSSNDAGGIKVTNNTEFTANGVTISGNKAESEEGGGVKNQGKTSLTNCTISGNSAKKDGGGIFNEKTDSGENGYLYITSCKIYNNSTKSNGGGIYSDCMLELKGDNFIGKFTVDGTTYPGNKADGKGAGMYIGKDSYPLTKIRDKLVMQGNEAVIGKDIYLCVDQKLSLSASISGTNIGSIDMQELGAFTVYYSTYHSNADPGTFFNTDNTAMPVELTSYGEASIRSAWPDLQRDIDNTQAGETLTLDSGYIADYDDNSLTITKDITIDLAGFTLDRSCIHERDNKHVFEVKNGATLTIKDSSTNKTGTITGGWAENGGGIYVNENATLKIEGGTISGNNAKTDGGGIYVAGTLIMTGGTITGNYADDTGGAIYVTDTGKIDLLNVQITNNTADNMGGGINMHMKENSFIENCTISGNTVVDDVGGGIRVAASGRTLTIKNSHIDNNYSRDDGGGIYLKNGTIVMTGGTISGNTSINDGGGIKVTESTTFTANNVTISNNSASTEEGGGIKNLGTTSLTNCNIIGNVAKKQGGGIFNDDSDGSAGSLTIEGCTISDNSATGVGGGIYSDYKLTIKGKNVIGPATVDGKTYAGNSSKERGGGIFVGKDSKFIKVEGALIVKGNKADEYGNDVFLNGMSALDGTYLISQILTITGPLKNGDDNAEIHVDIATSLGLLTSGYAEHNTTDNATVQPDTYFFPAVGYDVELKDGEAVITSDWESIKHEIENHEGSAPVALMHDYAAGPDDDRIVIPEGKNITVDLNGHTLNRNRTSKDKDGHVFEVFGTLTIADYSSDGTGTITGGWAENGGGINIGDTGKLIFESGTISGNKASTDGGGIYVHGTLEMTGGKITGNTAEEDGGGICLDDNSTLILSGGTITGNTGGEEGGGIFVDDDGSQAKVSGSPVVYDNNAIDGYDIYLQGGRKLTVTGSFGDSARMGVSAESNNVEVVFTSGYSTYNPGKAPSLYFISNDGYEVYLSAGEAAFRISKEDGTQFIPKNSQIADFDQLGPKNWMAGISGERYLNEINLPGSHDSGMKSLYHWSSDIMNLGAIGSSYAYTQRRYIDEQMEDGIRKFDVRLNPYYVTKGLGGAFRMTWDDGKNCWLAHGKNAAVGTYYAKDHDGSQLSLDDVLDYVKEFLQKHPTEVLILDFSPEVAGDESSGIKKVEERLTKILTEFAKEINPSTGKPYLYLEDGVFGKQMTYYPQLKDVRGQVITNYQGGFEWKMQNTVKEYSPEGETKEPADMRVKRVVDFYTDNPMPDLPTDARTHYDFVYHIKTNSTNQMAQTPLELVDKIHPALYGEGKLIGPDNAGRYLGYVNMDGANATDARYVWETNFFDGLDYCTVNVESGLENTAQYPDQSYQLLRYTPITIPKNIYNTDPQTLGKYFAGWREIKSDGSDGTLWAPGQTYELTEDVTFRAEWTSEKTTPIQVIWKDGDDEDELRPQTLTFNINGASNFSLTEENSWTGLYTGEISSIVPVWDKINISSDHQQGEDKTGQYRYEMTGEPVTGYVFTLVHTPQSTVSVSGTVEWNDDNDKDGKRPDSVTLHLFKNGTETESVEATAANDWQYSFGDKPEYADGERIEYVITENEITDYAATIAGFAVTNTLLSESQHVYAEIHWDDNNNAAHARPKTVTLNLLANGEVIDTQPVDEDEYGDWEMDFDITEWLKTHSETVVFSVTAEEIPGYKLIIKQAEAEGEEGETENETGIFIITYSAEALAVTISGVSGSFNDKIKLNYYFTFPDEVTEEDTRYVTLTNENTGNTITLPVKNAEYVTDRGYKFSISLAAKEASDTITARVFNGSGEAITVLGGSGTDYTESGVQYTMMQYFTWLETSDETTDEEKAVGAAAKDYCTAAQIYFKYHADGLAVSSAVEAVTTETLSGYVAVRDGTLPADVGIKGITAMLESDNTLRLYLNFENGTDGYTFAIDGKSANINQRSDGAYYLALDTGVYSNHLQDIHTYSVSKGADIYTISASVLTYARACAIKNNKTESDLGKALYLYNRAAAAAFGE